METFNDIFKPKVVAAKKADKIVNQDAIDCMNKARICLNNEAFKGYKKQYAKAESKMVDTMTALTSSYLEGRFDLTAYGAKMLVYMTRLKDLRLLLDVVKTDIRKGEKNG